MRRRTRILFVTIVALFAALVAGAWWAAQSETALAWITARLEELSGGRLRTPRSASAVCIASFAGSIMSPRRR